MNEMFVTASRSKLRFDSPKGMLTVEDLWDLPLTSSTGKANLDSIAMGLHRELKAKTEVSSFVSKETPTDKLPQLKFDVVKHVIDTKLVENEVAAQARANSEKKQQLLALIASKENEQLAGKSLDELKALVGSM